MSYFGCDLCFAKSTRYTEAGQDQAGRAKRDNRKKAKGATHVWGAGVRGEFRTHDRHMELAARAGPSEDEENNFYGVHEGELFLTEVVPHLDIVTDIVIDWMHNVCEGDKLKVVPPSY